MGLSEIAAIRHYYVARSITRTVSAAQLPKPETTFAIGIPPFPLCISDIFFGYYALHSTDNDPATVTNRIRCLQRLQITRTTTCISCQAAQRTFVTPIVIAAAAAGRRRYYVLL